MKDLTYHKNGKEMKTSLFLRNRGTCCKTNCLHCPYEFTIKKNGLQFEELTNDNFAEAEELTQKDDTKEHDVTAMLLESAYGKPKKKSTLSIKNREDYLLVKLKGETCALVKKTRLQATEIFIKDHFEDQGITLELVNSYLY